ncbi:hypothetical protein [Brevundimonas sp. FT23042]
MHHTHKEPAWGWLSVLEDWRRSRTRRRLRARPGSDAANRR